MTHRQRFAIQGVTIGKAVDPLAEEEALHPVAERAFARILAPPRVVDRPVADGTPAVVAERNGLPVAQHRGHVEVASIGGQARGGAGHLEEELAADLCGPGPERAILLRTPARP